VADQARDWVSGFVRYNTEHLHSALNFVTPDYRYNGRTRASWQHGIGSISERGMTTCAAAARRVT
jgi:hypothetical protein